MMRVPSKDKYMGMVLILCVAACACPFLTTSVGERWEAEELSWWPRSQGVADLHADPWLFCIPIAGQ